MILSRHPIIIHTQLSMWSIGTVLQHSLTVSEAASNIETLRALRFLSRFSRPYSKGISHLRGSSKAKVSRSMAEIEQDGSSIMKGGDAEKASDFANYFCSYAFLYHQKQMLMDDVRMRAYHNAIMQNKSLFEGKVVLDVGTGSGVLAIWAAQAGAAKVYAVEYTDMAVHARKMVEQNGVSDIVEVIQSSVEDLELPCKVDIIVSEWMGYYLLRESMLDSVIRARNKWMKPEGSMFPSHATMYWAAISSEEDREGKFKDYTGSMREWEQFGKDMKSKYSIDCTAISKSYEKEQIDYYIYFMLLQVLHLYPHR